MFIGPKALTFSAAEVIGYGKSDGLPRNEIDDSGMSLKKPLAHVIALGTRKLQLGELIDHPELFCAYPGLRKTKVKITSEAGNEVSNTFKSLSGNIVMRINPEIPLTNLLRHIAHETQHNIQQVEGFTGGADQLDFLDEVLSKTGVRLRKRAQKTGNRIYDQKSAEMALAADLLEEGNGSHAKGRIELAADQLVRRSTRIYRQVPGEVEAHATAMRLKMSTAERAAMPAPHLQPTPPVAPRVRTYCRYEQAVLNKHARRQKMVLIGARVTQAFNSLFGKGVAASPAPKTSGTAPRP